MPATRAMPPSRRRFCLGLSPTLVGRSRADKPESAHNRISLFLPLSPREREGPAAQQREGEGQALEREKLAAEKHERKHRAAVPSPSHRCAMGPSLSRRERGNFGGCFYSLGSTTAASGAKL